MRVSNSSPAFHYNDAASYSFRLLLIGIKQRGRNGGNDVPPVAQFAYLHVERAMEVSRMHEAYQPVIEDGRGIFPEDLRVKAPRGALAAIAAAAQLKHTSRSEYVRQAILRCLDADGVRLRRGMVMIASGTDG
jgi:hypothetical protein